MLFYKPLSIVYYYFTRNLKITLQELFRLDKFSNIVEIRRCRFSIIKNKRGGNHEKNSGVHTCSMVFVVTEVMAPRLFSLK